MDLTPNLIVLWVALVVATLSDLRNASIRNWLTFSLMAFGIVYHAIVGPDRLLGLVGCGAAFALHFPLWAGQIERAGDAKLFMGLGACVGWVEMVEASLWFAILYIPVGFATLTAKGRLSNFVAATRWTVQTAMGQSAGERPEPTMMIGGPTILVAGLIGSTTDTLRTLVFG